MLSEFDATLLGPAMGIVGFKLPQNRLLSISTNSFISTVTGVFPGEFAYFAASEVLSLSFCFFTYSGDRIISNNLMLRNPGNYEYYNDEIWQ